MPLYKSVYITFKTTTPIPTKPTVKIYDAVLHRFKTRGPGPDLSLKVMYALTGSNAKANVCHTWAFNQQSAEKKVKALTKGDAEGKVYDWDRELWTFFEVVKWDLKEEIEVEDGEGMLGDDGEPWVFVGGEGAEGRDESKSKAIGCVVV